MDIVKNRWQAAADLAQADAGNEAKGMTLAEREKKLERARKKVDAAVRRLEEEKVELMSLEEKQAELELMRDNESELDAVIKEGAAHGTARQVQPGADRLARQGEDLGVAN